MEKAIAHPIDSKLYNKMREHLVKEASDLGISLRQNYNQVAPDLLRMAGRYGHAKQYQRMRKASNKLRTILGRVIRDIECKAQASGVAISASLAHKLEMAKKLKAQQRNKSKDKIYAIHAPEVSCIAKGKAKNPYEFGAKVSIAVTAKDCWVVGARTFQGNPWDGNTLFEAFDQIKAITDYTPKQVFVDRGYRSTYLGQGTDVIVTGPRHVGYIWRPHQLTSAGSEQFVEPTIAHRSAIAKSRES